MCFANERPDWHLPIIHRIERQELSLNRNTDCTGVAKAVYCRARCRYQLLLLQMSGWWQRGARAVNTTHVCVKHVRLINFIAQFACAIPDLSELQPLAADADRIRFEVNLEGPSQATMPAGPKGATSVNHNEELRIAGLAEDEGCPSAEFVGDEDENPGRP